MKHNQNSLDTIRTLLYKELDPAFARRARIIATSLEPVSRGHVLEIGCGRGFYEGFLPHVYPKLTMTALDQNETYLAVARERMSSKRVSFIQGDALNLPFKKNTFDAAFATEVLEHLDDKKALSELFRVVKPGGIVIVSVPHAHYPFLWDPLNWILERYFGTHVSKDIWWLAGIWADHVRLYTPNQLINLAQQLHFKVQHLYRSTHYSLPLSHFLLYGIGKNIVELGLLPDFYRFNLKQSPSLLLRSVRSLMYSQDAKNRDSEDEGVSTVNLILTLKKSK